MKKTVIRIKRKISLIDLGTAQGLGGTILNLSLNLSKQGILVIFVNFI